LIDNNTNIKNKNINKNRRDNIQHSNQNNDDVNFKRNTSISNIKPNNNKNNNNLQSVSEMVLIEDKESNSFKNNNFKDRSNNNYAEINNFNRSNNNLIENESNNIHNKNMYTNPVSNNNFTSSHVNLNTNLLINNPKIIKYNTKKNIDTNELFDKLNEIVYLNNSKSPGNNIKTIKKNFDDSINNLNRQMLK